MAASLMRRGTYNSQEIKFELETTMAAYEASDELSDVWYTAPIQRAAFHLIVGAVPEAGAGDDP